MPPCLDQSLQQEKFYNYGFKTWKEATRRLQAVDRKTLSCWKSEEENELAWYLPKARTFLYERRHGEALARKEYYHEAL